ncbi:MAG: catalase [Candidatus Obscuribacter sp.]|nr:catalase [Candidatus Obscuribacter sp.]
MLEDRPLSWLLQVYKNSQIYFHSIFKDRQLKTPVFVRFSQWLAVAAQLLSSEMYGALQSEFYTEQGNFDLVDNNNPVFFLKMP